MKTNLIISTLILSIVILSCQTELQKEKADREKALVDIAEKYKCANCEDCVSKYNFEGARAYLATESWRGANFRQELEVLTAETFYWVKQKEYARALNIVDEFQLDGHEQGKEKIKFNILSRIVDDYISIKDFDNAKLYVLKASDNINLDGENKADNPSAWDEKSEMKSWRSQRTELFSRLDYAEKLLKKK